jgi:hypothetical protein
MKTYKIAYYTKPKCYIATIKSKNLKYALEGLKETQLGGRIVVEFIYKNDSKLYFHKDDYRDIAENMNIEVSHGHNVRL